MKINGDKLKAYGVGIVIGAIALTIAAFSMGWVVTKSSMTRALADSRVELLSSVCLVDAKANLQSQTPVPDLTGWDNRDARTKLAQQFAPVLPGKAEAAPEVIAKCADKIQEAQLSAS